jgi:DNA helicase-2/ATP-dependent DNA helicase PcrA
MPSRFIEEIQKSGATELVTSYGTKPRPREAYAERDTSFTHLLNGSSTLNGRTFKPKRTAPTRTSYFSDSDSSSTSDYSQIEGDSIRKGARVVHNTFGEGRVLEVAGRGDKAKAMVDFPKFGRKSLMLKFANLKVL